MSSDSVVPFTRASAPSSTCTPTFDASLRWNKSHTEWYMFMRQLVLPVVFDLPYMDQQDYRKLLRPLTACLHPIETDQYLYGCLLGNKSVLIHASHHTPQPIVPNLMISLASVSSRFAFDILGASFTPCMHSAIYTTAILGNWPIFCALHDSIARWHNHPSHRWDMATRRVEQQQLLTDLQTSIVQQLKPSWGASYSTPNAPYPLFRWFVCSVEHWDTHCSWDSLYALFHGFYQAGDVDNTCMVYKKLIRRSSHFFLVEHHFLLAELLSACLRNNCPLMLARLLDIECRRVPPHHRNKWFRRMKRQCLWAQCMLPKPVCSMRLWILCIYCAASLDDVRKAHWFPDPTDWLVHHHQSIPPQRLSHMAGYLHMTECEWITSTITLESSFFFDLMQRGTPEHTLVRTLMQLKPFREHLCHMLLTCTALGDTHIEQLLSVVGRQAIISTIRPHLVSPWSYKTSYPHMQGVCHCDQLGHCCHVLKRFNLLEGTGMAHNNWCIKHVLPLVPSSFICDCAEHMTTALGLDMYHQGDFFLDQSMGAPTAACCVPYSHRVAERFLYQARTRIHCQSTETVEAIKKRLGDHDDAAYDTVDICSAFLADIDGELTRLLHPEQHPEATIELCHVVRYLVRTCLTVTSTSDHDVYSHVDLSTIYPSINSVIKHLPYSSSNVYLYLRVGSTCNHYSN